jgi:hypothetical protein
LSIMQRVSDITASLHAEARYKIGALLRANNVVEVEMPNHLAILYVGLGRLSCDRSRTRREALATKTRQHELAA